jgi:hypothetical protein
MRYVLTVDGVPVGFVYLPAGHRVAGYLVPFEAFVSTGLAEAALRRGLALTLSHGPSARPSPRQRRLVQAVLQERQVWSSRLGLLDARGWMVPAGKIGVFWCAERRPLVIVDLRLLPVRLGASIQTPPGADRAVVFSPAA